ncbi:CAP domain-containing protein [Shouchella clausii]|jgi:uncharacterized YkwD family protein|uniref:SCP domain-containing protein n=1 Tax=Shouchella clausii TaxID=79880 RepID=A0A268RYG0_SHOCL|nr:CAP domain-containing protein [Shouchella clausii]PAD43108.1 hypothetical protein CHH54_08830 [Bacillus sp. 7520-S]SPU20803.1 Allergen V5/Tpx-1 related [Niallia circulans]AST97187.1 hypothetical protein BC8716_14950 [Shouchella clausii]MBU8594726.1 hypothetical protein [Shouchella clausii]MCM3547318.1 CAP domain-containing protein [Shouchella clausii]
MKKLVISTLAAAAIVGAGFSNQADAAGQYKVQVKGPYVYTASGDCVKVDLNELKEQFGNVDWSNVNLEDLDFVTDLINKEEAPAPAPEEEAQPEAPEVEAGEPTNTPEEQETVEEEPQQEESDASGDVTQEEQQMVDLVNQEREKAGLQPLKVDQKLTEVARVKAQDMIDNNYFDHNSPTYGSPFDMMKQFGISYNTAGENLAGNQTVDAAHNALMNSQGHRENILNSNYTEVGIGVVDGGPYGKMFVQLFKG